MVKYSIKPLKLSQNRLPLQFGIIVPKSYNNKKIDAELFKKRVDSERDYLSRMFNGDTTIRAVGDYYNFNKDAKGKEIGVESEPNAIIEVATTPNKFEQKRKEIIQHIKNKKVEWGQSQILYKIEGESFLFPLDKSQDSWKTKQNIKLN